MNGEHEVRDLFLSRILSAFGLEEPIFEAEFLEGGKPRPLERLGIFVPDSPNLTAYCRRCDDYTPVEVRQDESGQTTYWRVCCGPPKQLSPSRFRVWHVRQEPFLERFVKAVGIKGTMTEIVTGRVWKLGRRGQQVFLYVNRVMIPDLKTLGPVLSRFPNAVIVVPSHEQLERLNIVLPNRGIILKEVTRLDERYRIRFDMEKIEAIIEPETLIPTKPTARRGSRSANIEKLVAELKEHYRRSKDHYYTTGDLLPRPTQEGLAKRVGVRQDAVSRCLNDPDATILQMLWKNAGDIRAVLNS